MSVFKSELLTEVTLGLFLHSGDGTVLVCEEKLLELGHLVLEHGHFILKTQKHLKSIIQVINHFSRLRYYP